MAETLVRLKNTREARAHYERAIAFALPASPELFRAQAAIRSLPAAATAGEPVLPPKMFRVEGAIRELWDRAECPEMVIIPAGRFSMGSSDSEPGRDTDENPVHRAAIPRAFAAGKYEVTVGEYAAFAQETARSSSGCFIFKDGKFQNDSAANWQSPGFAQTANHPVACVNWDDAKAYAEWLTRKSGKNYRLLSEAEWEYAARAGTTTAYYWGDNANAGCSYANGADQTAKATLPANFIYANCSDGHTYNAPAGSFQPNAFGLHDMSGNVWEWTEDCWNANYNGAPNDGSAWTSGECGRRVVRGGSW